MKKHFFSTLAAALIISATLVACNSGGEANPTEDSKTTVKAEPMEPKVEAPKDVIDVAMGSADHSTLVAAIKSAGLVETLKGTGPFTVFAPTNSAFNALPAGTVEGLLKPESKEALIKILTYHVVAGSIKASELKDGQMVKTLQGGELKVTIKDGKVMINGANVTAADLISSNGVIHVIDAVLMPKK